MPASEPPTPPLGRPPPAPEGPAGGGAGGRDARGVLVTVPSNGKRYVVEAALPLASLGFTPAEGMTLRGDVGVTHSDQAGTDTSLRTWWSNQETGSVSDEVFELKMTPAAWGEVQFK